MTQYRNVSVGGIKASQLCAFPTSIYRIEADGVRVFYRAAGDTAAPVVLLLHGFPTSLFMFRELAPRLADNYRVFAPDLPGFGFTEVPAERRYVYSFDGLAATIKAFTEELKISRFAVYVFDYGAQLDSPPKPAMIRCSHHGRFYVGDWTLADHRQRVEQARFGSGQGAQGRCSALACARLLTCSDLGHEFGLTQAHTKQKTEGLSI